MRWRRQCRYYTLTNFHLYPFSEFHLFGSSFCLTVLWSFMLFEDLYLKRVSSLLNPRQQSAFHSPEISAKHLMPRKLWDELLCYVLKEYIDCYHPDQQRTWLNSTVSTLIVDILLNYWSSTYTKCSPSPLVVDNVLHCWMLQLQFVKIIW